MGTNITVSFASSRRVVAAGPAPARLAQKEGDGARRRNHQPSRHQERSASSPGRLRRQWSDLPARSSHPPTGLLLKSPARPPTCSSMSPSTRPGSTRPGSRRTTAASCSASRARSCSRRWTGWSASFASSATSRRWTTSCPSSRSTRCARRSRAASSSSSFTRRRAICSTGRRASPGLFGGLSFTGSGKHYVKYRDNTSPLGYDIGALHTDPGRFRPLLRHLHAGLQPREGLGSSRWCSALAAPRCPARDEAETRAAVAHRAARAGRARCSSTCGATACAPRRPRSSRRARAGRSARAASLLLVKVHDLPGRMLALFQKVPGIEVHRPVGDNTVVEVGYRHPFRLESCTGVFEKDKFYVFSGTRDAVDVLATPPPLVPGNNLVAGGFDLGERAEPRLYAARRARQARGRSSSWCRRPPRAAASPPRWSRGRRPPGSSAWSTRCRRRSWRRTAWRRSTRGCSSSASRASTGCPSASMFQEAAPSIYVPLGHEFLPRVSAAVLTDHVGGISSRYVVFPLGADEPLALEHALFEPLGRRALARLEAAPRRATTACRRRAPSPRPRWSTRTSASCRCGASSGCRIDDPDADRRLAQRVRAAAGGRRRRAHPRRARAARARRAAHARRSRWRAWRGEVVGRIGEARHAVAAELVIDAPEPDLDTDALRLAVAVHNLLFLSHPGTRAASVRKGRLAEVAAFAAKAGAAAAARERARAGLPPLDAAPPVRHRPRRRARQLLGRPSRVQGRRAAPAAAQVAASSGACARSAGASASSPRR